MSGRYILFRVKKIKKVDSLTKNAGILQALYRKSSDVETFWCQEFDVRLNQKIQAKQDSTAYTKTHIVASVGQFVATDPVRDRTLVIVATPAAAAENANAADNSTCPLP